MISLSRRALLACVPMAVLAAACGGNGGASKSGLTTKGPGPGHYKMNLGGYSGPELTGKPITLRLMRQAWNGNADKVFDRQIAAFKAAYPNITVNEELVPYGDLSEKLRTAFAANSAPDIAMGESALIPSYVYGQMAVPVGDFMTRSFIDSIYDDLVKAITVDGHVYGVPSFHNTQGVLYNKELFRQAGLDTPPESTDVKNGWTLDKWFETWAALRTWMDRSGRGSMFPIAPSTYGNGGPGSNYQQLEQAWIRMQGSPDAPHGSDEYKVFSGISPDGRTVKGYVNNALAVKGMTNYQTLFAKNWTPTGSQPTMFESGQAATRFGASVIQAAKFEQGVAPLPRAKIVAGSDASDAFIVTTQSKHPAEATALLAALNTVDVMTQWTEAWIQPPALKSVTSNLPAEFKPIQFQISIAVAAASYPPPQTPGWFEYTNQMNQAVRNIALGAGVAKSLDAAAQAIDQQLAKYHK